MNLNLLNVRCITLPPNYEPGDLLYRLKMTYPFYSCMLLKFMFHNICANVEKVIHLLLSVNIKVYIYYCLGGKFLG